MSLLTELRHRIRTGGRPLPIAALFLAATVIGVAAPLAAVKVTHVAPALAAGADCGPFVWPNPTLSWPPSGSTKPVKLTLPPFRVLMVDGATQQVNAEAPLVGSASTHVITIMTDDGWKGSGPNDALVDIAAEDLSNALFDAVLPSVDGSLDAHTLNRIILDRLQVIPQFHPAKTSVHFQIYRATRAISQTANLEVIKIDNIPQAVAEYQAKVTTGCSASNEPPPSPEITCYPWGMLPSVRPQEAQPGANTASLQSQRANVFVPYTASGSGGSPPPVMCHEQTQLEEAKFIVTLDRGPDGTFACDGTEQPGGGQALHVVCRQSLISGAGIQSQALKVEYIRGTRVGNIVIDPHLYRPIGVVPAGTVGVELSLQFRLENAANAQALEFGVSHRTPANQSELAVQWDNLGSRGPGGWGYWTGCIQRGTCTSDEDAWQAVGLKQALTDSNTWYTLVVRAEVTDRHISRVSCLNADGEVRTINAPYQRSDQVTVDELAVFVQPDGNYQTGPRDFAVTVDAMRVRAFSQLPPIWDRC